MIAQNPVTQLFVPVLLFWSICITACTGQHDRAASINAAADSIGRYQRGFPSPVPGYIDPMFYIEGQLCQHLRTMFEDSKGNLWMGTNVYGLMRYDGDTLEYFDENDGLGKGRINSITEDNRGNIWFAIYGGLSKYDGIAFTNYALPESIYENEVGSIFINDDSTFWVGTMRGLCKFEDGQFIPLELPQVEVAEPTPRYSTDRIKCLMKDRDGRLWIGTDGEGIHIHDPQSDSFEHLSKEDGLCDNNISGMKQLSNGDVWIATMFGGISRYDGSTFHNYTRDGIVEGIEVGALFEDPDGYIWFASENQGVYRFDGNEFVQFDEDDGLNTGGVLTILKDREGRFWFGGWGGLFKFNGKSFVTVTKDGPWD